MILFINTTYNNVVWIILKRRHGSVLASSKFKARFRRAEKLLPAIEKLLKVNKLKLSDLGQIEVKNSGGSFTTLRIGVVTANALAYALKISVLATADNGLSKIIKSGQRNFNVVQPIYDKEPEITVKKCVMLNSVIARKERSATKRRSLPSVATQGGQSHGQ